MQEDLDSISINAKKYFLLGLEYIFKEDWANAERELKLSLSFIPNRISTLTNLSATLIKLRKFVEAGDLIRRALALDSRNPELILNQGICFSEEQRYSEALASFERSIEIKIDYAEAWGNRGLALSNLGRHEEALTSYEQS